MSLADFFRGYRQKQMSSSGPRGSEDAGSFTPVIGGWAFVSIFIAFVTFGYFFVQYRLVPDLLIPSVLGFLELLGGLGFAAVLVKVRVRLNLFDGLNILLAGVATATILFLEILVNSVVPASGQSATAVTLNPAAEVLWYYSQGVAEACAWILFAFSALLKSFNSFAVAMALSSLGFMVYHLGVVNLIYMGDYWASLPFLVTIFAANVVWSVYFYFRRNLGVVSWSHGMLNVIVTVLGLLGLVAISFSGYHLQSAAVLPSLKGVLLP